MNAPNVIDVYTGLRSRRSRRQAPEFCNHRIVIAQCVPARAAHHAARYQAIEPAARDEDAIAVIRRRAVGAPAQCLRQRPIGMRGLPAADQFELLRKPIQDVSLAATHPDFIPRTAVARGDVEIAAQNQVGSLTQRRDAIEYLLHRADVTVFARRCMDAENAERPCVAQRRKLCFGASDPTLEARQIDWCESSTSGQKRAAPAPARNRLPQQRIAWARSESLL